MKLNSVVHMDNSLSTNQWEGSRPSKFKGGKMTINKPTDELDYLLLGNFCPLFEDQGKKHFNQKQKESKLVFAPQSIKTFDEHYQKSMIFQAQKLTKVQKIDRRLLQQKKPQQNNISLKMTNSIGMSKMKQLQTGKKKTGIYRNFYKSQIKSAINVGGELAFTENKQ